MTIMKVDSTPIYLGYEKDRNKYCFYYIKSGVPRFLSYISYFFLDRGPDSVLEYKAIPAEIEQELSQYLKGSIDYEFFKPRRNSKQQSVRKIYKFATESETGADIEPSADSESRRVRGPKPGVSSGVNPVPERPTDVPEPTIERRPRRLRHASDAPPEPPLVEVKKPRKTKAIEVVIDVPVQETPAPVKVDPKMLKALKKMSSLPKANEPEMVPVVKVKKLKKVLEPQKSELPVEAPVKKRGRPRTRNVPTLENPKEVVVKSKKDKGDNGISIRPEVNVTIEKKTRKRKPT